MSAPLQDGWNPERLADEIIQRANWGYHRRDDYPRYAAAPWDDRLRWSDYIRKVAVEVLSEQMPPIAPPPPESKP